MKTFLKNNKKNLILSCLAFLVPVLVGLLLWNKLPDTMHIHWGADGAADGQGSKAMAVFLPAGILLLLHIACLLITGADKKQARQSRKITNILFWILPVLTFFVYGILYGVALGMELSVFRFLPAFFGALFLVMGNYMPKAKPNHTFGIRFSWTLQNEENWVKTHRFAGKVWFIGGLVMVVSTFLPMKWNLFVFPAIILLLVALPLICSYKIYKAHKAAGIEYAPVESKSYKAGKRISLIVVPLLLVGVAVLMFTGDVSCTFGETSFTVDSIYHESATVSYADITSVEYAETMKTGTRTFGFGSAKLSLGSFHNEELGAHTRYTYNSCKACVVVRVEDRVLVFNAKTAEETKELYTTLLSKIN